MASANVELVRSVFKAWDQGEFGTAEWAHPEIEFVLADGPDAGSVRGLAAMAAAMGEFLGTWAECRIEADGYRELDDERVLVLQHYSARGRASGLDLGHTRAKGANLFHLRDGKVTRLVCYFERERALADLRLTPDSGGPVA